MVNWGGISFSILSDNPKKHPVQDGVSSPHVFAPKAPSDQGYGDFKIEWGD